METEKIVNMHFDALAESINLIDKLNSSVQENLDRLSTFQLRMVEDEKLGLLSPTDMIMQLQTCTRSAVSIGKSLYYLWEQTNWLFKDLADAYMEDKKKHDEQ